MASPFLSQLAIAGNLAIAHCRAKGACRMKNDLLSNAAACCNAKEPGAGLFFALNCAVPPEA